MIRVAPVNNFLPLASSSGRRERRWTPAWVSGRGPVQHGPDGKSRRDSPRRRCRRQGSTRIRRGGRWSCAPTRGAGAPIPSVAPASRACAATNRQQKAEDVLPYLNDRCVYLVGMMGSGKTTVGKIIAEVLGYSFFDSDKLVEQSVGIPSVAEIFQVHSEAFFRDNESEVLRDLSSMHRLIVATGGGAVIRPINWSYMRKGLTIWLDVPLDALARRIAAVGTASRPLLHQESGDPYAKAYAKLTALFEQRMDSYANADARVSLENIAFKQGHNDVNVLTPSAIAIEALLKMESFLTEKAVVRN
ncbi:hypothetical protein ACQJBY_012445 [Aegilops geniculata]